MNRLLRLALWLALPFLACGCTSSPTRKPYRISSEYGVEDPQFARTMGSLLGPALVSGNQVRTLVNGREIFPAMLAAIRAATVSITFETFVYWQGQVGKEFTEALAERARAGVKVHVMIDPVGSNRIDKNYIKYMEDAGVEVELYNPLKLFSLRSFAKLNNRTHRKLLVVDGKVGFTGGVGIADEWQGDADSRDHWRDNHYRIEGPAVAQLQAAFVDHWMESNGVVLHGEAYFPQLSPAGDLYAQVFKSSPESGSESMQLMYLLSIAAARKQILISTRYFVVDDTTTWHLVEARRRGVRVVIITPDENIDLPFVRHASHFRWGPLLAAGIEIHEYQPTMYHAKLMVVDGLWTSIGSANLDNRSFKLNSEANVNVLDRRFAEQQIRIFEHDLSMSRRITYEQWKKRPLLKKVWESIVNLLGPQL
jgi:cardiolipin synthase